MHSFPTPAEQQIREIRAITDRYRKNLPIWNTELYYIQSCPSDQKIGGITDWIAAGKFPARNTAKRYLIDLGAGTKSSIALNGYQYLHNDLRPHFGYSSQWAIAEMIPNAHFIVGNTFARFLEGAVPVKQLKLLDGINGFLYRTRDKKEIAAVWAINEDETFKADFSASGIRVLDLFGNPLPGNAPIALTADPCYLSGKDLSRCLKSVIFHPERAYSITGIRQSAENGKKALAVEVRNHTAGDLALTLRMKGCETIRKVKLKGEQRKTLLFPLESEQKEITLLSSDGKIVESHTFPFSPVKSLRNGERVALNESCCFQVKSDEKALTVTIDVRDRKRGNRPQLERLEKFFRFDFFIGATCLDCGFESNDDNKHGFISLILGYLLFKSRMLPEKRADFSCNMIKIACIGDGASRTKKELLRIEGWERFYQQPV